MKNFTLFRFLAISIHWFPFIGITYLPKRAEIDNDTNDISLSFIFITFVILIRPKQQRKRQLIKATIYDNSSVMMKEDDYTTYYPFQSEKDINKRTRVYIRNRFGEYEPTKNFSYDKKMDRYIIGSYKGVGDHYKVALFRPDEVRLFMPGHQVEGYLEKGRFIVVS